jgi:hypothetical protein
LRTLRTGWPNLVPVERSPVLLAPIVRVDDLDRAAVLVHTRVDDVVCGAGAVAADDRRDADRSDDRDDDHDEERLHGEVSRHAKPTTRPVISVHP